MTIKYFFFSTVLVVFSFIVYRVIVRKDYLNKSSLSPVSYTLEIILFALHANLVYLFIPAEWPGLPALPDNKVLIYLSVITIGIGLAILIIAYLKLGSGPTLGQDKNKLQTKGIYRYSRNPQLLGYGMILIAVPILYPSWMAVGWFMIYFVISYFMTRSEEEFLEQKYAEEYKEYCKSVPKIILLF